ncbi:nitroreductase family deazaflavin-dependent oxidoreductase [Mycolicibacterium stellerae]|uniref:nitroreductase family deazaflavin-dependent oxidoreductase n=1 Tax=Mycolicibacterium stellerae TaxID=2358193 RepID=UPI000F0BC66A|nr:nitroreductase family deazaflavin-dependent oxidoreductase [Mycolicibacterium stellerae]
MPLSGEYEPSTSDWARENAEKYIESGGTEGTELKGKPVILLTTIGAKSGKVRKTPLMRVEHNGEYAVVASLGGAPKHPVWYHNIKKNPRVELQDGPTTRDYDSREVFGDEKAAWWERAVEAWPDYAEYQKKTDRQIPVFVLTPVS